MAAMDEEAEGWKRGEFQILFVSIGQGDCCVITCPDGAHIMIDCGSKGQEGDQAIRLDVQSTIRDTHVLGLKDSDRYQLRALILTHADDDHINKVTEVLGGATYFKGTEKAQTYAAIPVEKVYFSDHTSTRDGFKGAPLEQYTTAGCNVTLCDRVKLQELYCVTLKTGEQTLHKWTPPFREKQYTTANTQIVNNRVTVRSGRLATGKTWEVSIIAGNVKKEKGDKSDGDGCNAASLVTLVRIGDESILICGDATQSTENYLYNTFKNTQVIKTLALLQVPHHGSAVTSSTTKFRDLVKPQRVAFSVKTGEHSHHLPSNALVTAYAANAVDDEPHSSVGWTKVHDYDFENLKNEWIKGKAAKTMDYVEIPGSGTGVSRWVRTGSEDGEIILDGIGSPKGKYVLYQRTLKKEVKQTGWNQHLWYYFS